MAAKLATVDERILANAEGSGANLGGSVRSSPANEQPPFGEMHFDCGYISPFFITDPERMEVAFENVTFSSIPAKSVPRKTCFRYLSRSPGRASLCSSSRTMLKAKLSLLWS